MNRAGQWIADAVEHLGDVQLTTGELPSFHAGYYAPCPLLSMLAHDALACADPGSARFVSRIRDLVPADRQSRFFTGVATLRWRLRLYIAAEETADGTWRADGRHGDGAADASATACGAAALLSDRKWAHRAAERRHATIARRFHGVALPLSAAAHLLRFVALSGGDARPLHAAVRDRLGEAVSPASAHAVARAWRHAALPDRDGIARALLPALTRQLPASRLDAALAVAALIDLDYQGPRVAEWRRSMIDDVLTPRAWPNESYDGSERGSAGATLALAVANVIRAEGRR